MNDTTLREPWLQWAVEIQSIAHCGLAYCRDVYDIERYQRLRTLSAEMLAHQSDIPIEKVKDLFCCEQGYQTPKLDTRAAVFAGGRVLLVQEKNGLWTMPGGWMDVSETIASNTEKEAWEEAGVRVKARRIVAIQDWARNNRANSALSICKVFVLCRFIGGEFQPNSETLASGWFLPEQLPPLCEDKTTPAQIALCLNASQSTLWETVFD